MTDTKTDQPFKPQRDAALVAGAGEGPPSDWNPNARPLDGSPVKTSVPRPYGRRYIPKTVAQHNAWVESLSHEQYPPEQYK